MTSAKLYERDEPVLLDHGLIHKGHATVSGDEVVPIHLLDLVAGRAPP